MASVQGCSQTSLSPWCWVGCIPSSAGRTLGLRGPWFKTRRLGPLLCLSGPLMMFEVYAFELSVLGHRCLSLPSAFPSQHCHNPTST